MEGSANVRLPETPDDRVVVKPLREAALARFVTRQPEIARARRVLVECYRRLTDVATPPCVVREIAGEIDGLERWLGREEPHLR